MASRKRKSGGPRSFAAKVAAEKKRREKQKRETNPELSFVFRFGMVFMLIYMIAWPVSAKIDFPLSYCLSLLMYLLLGWLLWRKPLLVIEVITRRGGDLDGPSLLKIRRRLRLAGAVMLALGLALSLMTAGNLSGLWPNAAAGIR